MEPTSESTIRQRLSWPITQELYDRIRRLWIRHSIAEDQRDLDGLIATLSEECVYKVLPTGQEWRGHDGARRFYQEFLTAFPDVHFDLQDIVIGPQGVIEVAEMTGTHHGPWAGIEATGRQIRLTIIIHFPWDPAAQKFAGENVYFDRAAMTEQLQGRPDRQGD